MHLMTRLPPFSLMSLFADQKFGLTVEGVVQVRPDARRCQTSAETPAHCHERRAEHVQGRDIGRCHRAVA